MAYGYDYDTCADADDLRAASMFQRRLDQRYALNPMDPNYPDEDMMIVDEEEEVAPAPSMMM